jgi:hypothetical protein
MTFILQGDIQSYLEPATQSLFIILVMQQQKMIKELISKVSEWR